MEKMRWRKVLLLSGILLYLIAGVLLALKGTQSCQQGVFTGQRVALDSNKVLRQRLLGNDYYIKKASFRIETENITPDGKLTVCLKKGGKEDRNSDVEEVEFIGSDLQGMREISISFPRTKLIYNRDYYIEFYFVDSNTEASIWFETDENGYGLENESSDYGLSLACDINYYSPDSKALFVWKIILVFGLSTVTLCLINRVMFWEANVAVCLFSVVCIYIFGLFDMLKFGYYALLVISVTMVLLLIWFVATREWEEIRSLWKRYIHGAFLCWCILLMFYFVADKGKMIQYWDELRHWAVAVKDMYLFDSFPVHQNTAVELVRYPPVYSAFQYLILQMYGRFSEGILHLAKHILMMALLMGCMENCDGKAEKRKLPLVVMGILCFSIPELFYSGSLMNSIYNDEIIGCAFAFILVYLKKVVENGSLFNIFSLSGGVFLCILSKDSGLIAVLITLCAIICILTFLKIQSKIWDRKWILGGLIIFATTVISEFSWHFYLNYKSSIEIEKVSNSFAGKSLDTVAATGLGRNAILDFLCGRAEPYKYRAIPLYFKRIFAGEDYPNSIFAASYILWMFVVCLLLFLIVLKIKRSNIIWLFLNALIGVGTAVAYLLLYIFTFPEEDTVGFASLERYLAVHLIAMCILMIFTLGQALDSERRREYWGINLCMCMTLLVLTGGCSNYRGWVTSNKEVDGKIDQEVIEKGKLLRIRLKETDSLYYISKDNPGARYLTTKYFCLPIQFNPRENKGKRSYYPVISEPRADDYQITEQEWREVLSHYDYLYIETCDSKFAEAYQKLFEDPNEVGDGILYLINKKEPKLLRYYASICP